MWVLSLYSVAICGVIILVLWLPCWLIGLWLRRGSVEVYLDDMSPVTPPKVVVATPPKIPPLIRRGRQTPKPPPPMPAAPTPPAIPPMVRRRKP